jgi:hypothetical protein
LRSPENDASVLDSLKQPRLTEQQTPPGPAKRQKKPFFFSSHTTDCRLNQTENLFNLMEIRPQNEILAPVAIPPKPQQAAPTPIAIRETTNDTFRTPLAQRLRAAFQAAPEVRDEAVAHGRVLATDPQYPPMERLNAMAELLVLGASRASGE